MRNKPKSYTKNVLMRDGTVRRVPEEIAEQLLESNQAQRYVSNTIFRAISLGIEVDDFSDRDEGGLLRAKIHAAHERVEKKRKKDDAKRVKEELDLLDEAS